MLSKLRILHAISESIKTGIFITNEIIFQNKSKEFSIPLGKFGLQSITVQYSTVEYSTVQYNTVKYNTVNYSSVQYNALL